MARPDPEPAAHERLARRLRDGDDVLGEWYAAEYGPVHRLALGFCGNAALADELTVDAMLHLIDHLDAWDPERPYGPWRTRVVLNLARNARRSEGRRALHERAAGEAWHERETPEPGAVVEAEDSRQLLERSLRHLPEREREVFVLVDLEGTSAADAAELLGIASSTVRAALSLARRRLRELLQQHLDVEGPAGAGSHA